jgi:hypothetical protein
VPRRTGASTAAAPGSPSSTTPPSFHRCQRCCRAKPTRHDDSGALDGCNQAMRRHPSPPLRLWWLPGGGCWSPARRVGVGLRQHQGGLNLGSSGLGDLGWRTAPTYVHVGSSGCSARITRTPGWRPQTWWRRSPSAEGGQPGWEWCGGSWDPSSRLWPDFKLIKSQWHHKSDTKTPSTEQHSAS